MTDKSLKDKAIKVKGGANYPMVKDRVIWLDENKNGQYSIDTDYKFFPDQRMWVVKAILTVDGQTYTGLAQEIESDDYKAVNHTSALENCETSAIGRACAAYGLGIQESYASQNEIDKARNQAKPASDKQTDMLRKTAQRITGDEDAEQLDDFIQKVVGYRPDQLSTKAVWQANLKLQKYQEVLREREAAGQAKEPDVVITDIPHKINLDTVPY